MEGKKSYVKNCFLWVRDGDFIFETTQDGEILPRLDRYAIIPIEEYEKLIQSETGTKKT
jgi:hypothetical protein